MPSTRWATRTTSPPATGTVAIATSSAVPSGAPQRGASAVSAVTAEIAGVAAGAVGRSAPVRTRATSVAAVTRGRGAVVVAASSVHAAAASKAVAKSRRCAQMVIARDHTPGCGTHPLTTAGRRGA